MVVVVRKQRLQHLVERKLLLFERRKKIINNKNKLKPCCGTGAGRVVVVEVPTTKEEVEGTEAEEIERGKKKGERSF